MYYVSRQDLIDVLELVPEEHRVRVGDDINGFVHDAFHDGYEDGYDSGLESSGDYVDAWIGDGEFDWAVEERARKIGYLHPDEYNEVIQTGDDMLQSFHRKHHKESAYHWTFCGKCSQIDL